MLDGKMLQERESAGRRRVALQFIRWFVIREGSGMVRVQEESVQRWRAERGADLSSARSSSKAECLSAPFVERLWQSWRQSCSA